MSCPGCGLRTLPFHETCEFCARILLEPERVGGRRAEWEALSEKLRGDFSADYERDLAARRAWRERLRRNRLRHGIAGAVLFAFLAGALHAPVFEIEGPAVALVLGIDLAVGAALGLRLNREGGGGYVGLALFGGGYLAWTAVELLLGIVAGPFERGVGGGFIWGLFVIPGSLVSATLGYLFGLSLSLRRSLEE
jgi:hypothetical protein